MFCVLPGKSMSLLILSILHLIILKGMIAAGDGGIINAPNLRLKVSKLSVTPRHGIVAGDTVVYSLEVYHTENSYAHAIDVGLQILSPVYLGFGSQTISASSVKPDRIIKSHQEVLFKFANISLSSHVLVTMDIHVDPYYVLGLRKEMIASCQVSLWYYSEYDSCHRPDSKWNARFTSENIRFTFMADKVCERMVGPLVESQFFASSFDKSNYNSLGNSPHHASFEYDFTWIPADTVTEDIHQYLQIELKQLTRVTKVATKGNGKTDPPRFVKKYLLYFSKDGLLWSNANSGFTTKEFIGNSDSATVKVNNLKFPVEATRLRIVPKEWKNKIALKVEVFGCPVYQVPAGYQPLGPSSGHAVLDLKVNPGGWCTTRSSKQTLVIDLGKDHFITELAVESRFQVTDNLITAFYLAYKKDGGVKTNVNEGISKKIFLGNPVEDTLIKHRLLETINAREVYIEPKDLTSTGCLRVQVYGYENQNPNAEYCDIIGFENGVLTGWNITGSAFDHQPTFFDNLYARTGHVVNHEGIWWIGTRENRKTVDDIPGKTSGNNLTGTLTSPSFLITFSKLFFLFAGSTDAGKARVELLVDDHAVRTTSSGTINETMVQKSWDVSDLVGSEARIRLVDDATDGFVSFDGLKSNCHPSQEQLPVFERSFLLSPSNKTLYVCEFSHSRNLEDPACRLTSDNGKSWKDLTSHIFGLLGVDEDSGKLYGVSRDRRYRFESQDWNGISWTHVSSGAWDVIKQRRSLKPVVEIPHIPITGLPETDQPSSVLTLTANSGDKFAASALGLHHKAPGGSWEIIVTWSCREYPDVCISNPCNNGGLCSGTSDGGFNCTCPQGFTGAICDNEVDDCQADSCLNGGTCLDDFNKFFCICNSFFTGQRCETNIDDCVPSPCSQGALCIDGLGNFTCQCPSGFIGEFCELEIDECSSLPCQNGGLCVDEVNSYSCHCRKGYSGTHCEHVYSSGFEVLSKRSIQYGISRYLVIHARIPSDGRSLHQTWCHEYQVLCHSLNKTRPTGCGRSSNHIIKNHECFTKYDSMMPPEDTLRCPPNIHVSAIARMAGYTGSTMNNSFAFSQCSDTDCTDELPNSGCHGALSCINQAVINREVYTICSDSDSNFVIRDKKYTSLKGVHYLELYVQPRTFTARHDDWCQDYQRLCQSFEKRPVGCGTMIGTDIKYSQCMKNYLSVMSFYPEVGCDSSIVNTTGQSTSLSSTSRNFTLQICSGSICQKELPSCLGPRCPNDIDVINCNSTNVNFNDNVTNVNATNVNVTNVNVTNVNVTNVNVTNVNVTNVNVTNVNTTNVNVTNCEVTNNNAPNVNVTITHVTDVEFHALCAEPLTSFAVLDEKRTVVNNVSLMIIKARLQRNRRSTQKDWCQDYFTLCDSYGLRPTGCDVADNEEYTSCRDNYGSVRVLGDFFGVEPQVKVADLARQAGFLSATSLNSFAFHRCTRCSSFLSTTDCTGSGLGCIKPTSDNDVYTLCVEPQTSFDIVQVKTTVYNNRPYLVVQGRLLENKKSNFDSWGSQYKDICVNLGRQPINCSSATFNKSSKPVFINSTNALNKLHSSCKNYLSSSNIPSQSNNSSLNNNSLQSNYSSSSNSLSQSNNSSLNNNSLQSNYSSSSNSLSQSNNSSLNNNSLQSNHSPSYNHSLQSNNSLFTNNSFQSNHSSFNNYSAPTNLPPCPSPDFLNYLSVISNPPDLCDNGPPDGKSLSTIAQEAGFSHATKDNTLISYSNQDDSWPDAGVVYIVCHGPDSNIDVISATPVKYYDEAYLLIEARLPSQGLSRHANWCDDYKQLCYSYGQRPTGCGYETCSSSSSCTACRENYDSLVPKEDVFGCPPNERISLLANLIGFAQARIGNTFAFSDCDNTCAKDLSEKNQFISANTGEPVYTVCAELNNSFIVESTEDVSHQGGTYKVIKARIPSHMIAKQKNWCEDYQKICHSYGLRAVVTSMESDLSCERNYNAILPKRNEFPSSDKLENLGKMAGYVNSSVRNTFAFNRTCQNCFANLNYFKSVLEPAVYVDSDIVVLENYVVYAVCMNSDSSFDVVDSRSVIYEDRSYLVLKTKIPFDGVSKFDTWCKDYQRLCTSYEMRPVTFLESNFPDHTSCIPDYMSVVIPTKQNSNLLAREHVAIIASQAGYGKASRDNSFALDQCNPNQCPRVLTAECSPGLDCITKLQSDVYTICTDSDSNFVVEKTRHVKHQEVPYLLIQSKLPDHGLPRHENWCSDYQHLCQSFGMQPTGCGVSRNDSGNTRCINEYQSFASPVDNIGCGDEAIAFLREMSEQSSFKNETVFLFKNCTSCSVMSQSVGDSCDDSLYCLRKNKTVITICTALQSHFTVLETNRHTFNGLNLTVARTRLSSNGSSFHQNWCHDYSRMCAALGKRPLSCGSSTDERKFKNREQYHAYLLNSGACPSYEVLSSLALEAGFPGATDENVLPFISFADCTKEMKQELSCVEVVDVIGELVHPDTNPKNCCKCSNIAVNSSNPLITSLQNSNFSRSWKECVNLKLNQTLNQTLNQILNQTVNQTLNQTSNQTLTQNFQKFCSLARDCLNDTLLANNSCEFLSECFYNNSFDCCACNYTTRNVCGGPKFITECPSPENCSDFNPDVNQDMYTFCSDYTDSNFEVLETRDVEYAARPYTVLRAQVPSHGHSKGMSWCEDYQKLCATFGKRPIGCGKHAEIMKRPRDCRVRYDAVMFEGMPCPGSKEVADIAMHAGFAATANQTVGLWSCEECSRNFARVWNTTNSSSNVYAVCSGSDSNFNVLEKRVVSYQGASVTVVMAAVPAHGLSLHEDWCRDYSLLCQSYGLRPVSCGKSKENINEHAQCLVRYNALMFSDNTIDCSDDFNIHSIAQTAGFKQATPENSFLLNTCLSHHCTRTLPSSKITNHAFGGLLVNDTGRVVYAVCASSDSAYTVLATKALTIEEQDYLVIRAVIPVHGKSKYSQWCEDYQRLCEGYRMQPLTCEIPGNAHQRRCMYDYESLTMSQGASSCPVASGVGSIAQLAGFDNVSSANSFALDYCDMSTSCVDHIPNTYCWNRTDYDTVINTVTTEANITRIEYTVYYTTNVSGVLANNTRIDYCYILPDPNPPFTVNGSDIREILNSFLCDQAFDSQTPGVGVSFFNLTVNQTFENLVPRITTLCKYNSISSLARMSGEVNTVCVRPSVNTNFQIRSRRTIMNSGRKYLVIKAQLVSTTSKSENWCKDYENLCLSFGTSPLACPRAYGFNSDYFSCLSNYKAVMMTDVHYDCPSNGFISQLARAAGYQEASRASSFSLFNCGERKCESKLPGVGCSESVHCLSKKAWGQDIYTACVVTKSDSNFQVIETRLKTFSGRQYTVIRAKIPPDGKSLHDSWCVDYQRLCESMNLRPVHCKNGLSNEESGKCIDEFNAVTENDKSCPINVRWFATSVGFTGPSQDNSFSFYRCGLCSRELSNSQCDNALRCLKTGLPLDEVYTICGDSQTKTSLAPLATTRVRHGLHVFRVVQAKLRSNAAATGDWGRDYENLCKTYNEFPTGCGQPTGDKDPGVHSCANTYTSYLLPGGELGCDPNIVISQLARDAGFVSATPSNSFGFSSCNDSASSQLSSFCSSYLPCLTFQESDPVVYTVCVKTSLHSNFKVLGIKTVKFLKSTYLVIQAQLPSNGRSMHSNWCVDYQKLCSNYGMVPTGCGGSAMNYVNYSSCGSTYGSYMPASNSLGCGDSKIASRIANKAGYSNSIPANTFIFHNCHQCSSVLADSNECDGALSCINNMVWKREVYTLCTKPTTSFNVVKSASIEYEGIKYLAIEARLADDKRSRTENWCRDYELLCKSYKKRPVSCQHSDNSRTCTLNYQAAVQPSFSCDSAAGKVSIVANQAGFAQATAHNSFILNDCMPGGCPKDLPASGCDSGLSCIHSNIVGNVYTLCLDESSSFRALESRKVVLSGSLFSILSAVLQSGVQNTWCQDYAKLCHAVGQSPVVLPSDVMNEDTLKCRDEYDGILMPKDMNELLKGGVQDLAVRAGFTEASYGNTFGFKSCSKDYCVTSPHAFNCSESLHCLNGQTTDRVVYAICAEDNPLTNFYVLDTKTLYTNNTKYLALKVRIPVHRLSKYESWCRDYERLCRSYALRPLAASQSRVCQVQYHGVFRSRLNYLSLVDLAHQAGFYNASSTNMYHFQQCEPEQCGRTFQLPLCMTGSCSSSANEIRDLYVLCSSMEEQFATNFKVEEVRNIWFHAAFLVAQVKLPSDGMARQKNWCTEYQTFCESYGRRPYTSADLSKKETFEYGACYWKYNTTSFSVPVSSMSIVEHAGFSPSSTSCVSSLYHCCYCGKHLDSRHCPLKNCEAAVKACYDYYIICS